jgi:N-carbamoyl-L-amino-acid hydrolase
LTGLPATGHSFYIKDKLSVDERRILTRIEELAKFGRDEKGRGYRVAYTQGDVSGRKWFVELMRNAKLDVSIDAGGNIIGKRKGKNPGLKPIAFGSHIDMVPDGGNYDGTLGSISGLEVIEVFNANNFTTQHPLELIVFGNEEGGTVGSKAMVGTLTEEDLRRVTASGLTIRDGLSAIGGNPDNLKSCVRNKGDYHAFLELHIEQGGILEKEETQIGVVEGIVGMKDWEVTFEGFANHAGATPMDMRQDALLAASKLVVAVNQVINGVPGGQVGTVGRIAAFPGATNVIPGKVAMSLEIRDLSLEKVEMLFGKIQNEAKVIGEQHKIKINFNEDFSLNPAITNEKLRQRISETSQHAGFTTKLMQSGAYHDSAQMSRIAPIAMIFVPSVGGISHSPLEFTKTEDMTNGANVLLNSILAVDKD